jgi:radical SAM superfamily enzyme YgiQ (UPF0313 family)
MKITFISVYESIVAYGMRSLSAVLKGAGFNTSMVFLPRETEGLRWDGFRYPFSEKVLDQVAELTEGSDLIGLSVMSNYFDNAVQVTKHLRRTSQTLIVWGGIHPTLRPEECLEHADIVCVGEGEEATLELAQRLSGGKDYTGISNMWTKQNGCLVKTPIRPLPFDLDHFPYPDYNLETMYVLHEGHIRPITEDLLVYYLRWPYDSNAPSMYTTMMSRGCTWDCTYCGNNALRKLYGKSWRVRRRSVLNFIGEIKQIVTRFPGIEWIRIEDDVFLDDVEMLKRFAEVYQHEIHLPMFIPGFQPSMVDEERVRLLIEAGMKRIRVGIQTGSIHTLRKVYKRPGSSEQIKRTFQVLHQFSHRIEPPMYDLIVDNPWETEEDLLTTLRLLLDLAKPYQLILFSLTYYPGTELYSRAKQEGLLIDEFGEVYRKDYLLNKSTYINGLFKLFQSQHAPRWLMALLLDERVRRLNWIWLPYFFTRIFWIGQLASAGWLALRKRNWAAFKRALRSHLHHRTQGN